MNRNNWAALSAALFGATPPPDWLDLLDRGSNRRPYANELNLCRIMEWDPLFERDRFSYNSATEEIFIADPRSRPLEDEDYTLFTAYIQATTGMLRIAKGRLKKVLRLHVIQPGPHVKSPQELRAERAYT